MRDENERRRDPAIRRAALLVGLAAFVVRLVVERELAGQPLRALALGDAARFDAWGAALAAGEDAGQGVYYQAPLYPAFVGLLYTLFGRSLEGIRLAQAVLGGATAGLTTLAGGRLFGRAAGLGAGLLLALHGPSVWLDGLVQKTALATFLTALVVSVFVLRGRRRSTPLAFAGGLTLGLLALTRENAAVLLPVLLAWVLCATDTGRWKDAGALLLGLALVLAPIAVRNARAGGAFLPTTSNAGVNFYLGNGPDADGGYRALVPGQGHPEHEEDDARVLAERATGRALGPAAVSAYWFGEARRAIAARPARWGALLVRKLGLLVDRHEIMDAESLESAADGSVLLAFLARVFSFATLFPLAVVGAWSRRRALARQWWLPAGTLALAASIVLFFVTARFRASLFPLLALCAGAGAADLIAARARLRTLAPGLSLASIALAATLLPVSLAGDPRAATESNAASACLRLERYSEAETWARRALARQPGNANARFNLGAALGGLGRDGEAAVAYRHAMEDEPAYTAEALQCLGVLRARAGAFDEALALFGASLEADPLRANAHYDLGLALRRSGDLAGAERAYRRALALDPALGDAHNNLGLLREHAGDAAGAIASYRAALAAGVSNPNARTRLAWLLATLPDPALRDPAEAVRLAAAIVQGGAAPDAALLDLIAAAHAAAGDFERAVEAAERALQLGPAAAVPERSRRLALYRAQTALEEPLVPAGSAR